MTGKLGILPAAILAAALLVSYAVCQAPDDGNDACPQSYPDTWKVLMDSWRYKDLLDDNNAVWEESSEDGDSFTWTPGVNGICRRDVRSCDYTVGSQNNWVFTQHISKDIPAEQPSNFPVKVYVNFTYSPVGCVTAQGCVRRFDVYNYLEDTPQTTAIQRDTSRYSLLQGIPTSGSEDVTIVLNFDLSQNQNGFYLAFQDPNTCVSIDRVIVYRHECNRMVANSLTVYPATPSSLNEDIIVSPLCDPNSAIRTSDTTVTCNTMGEWVGEPLCSCDEGYEQNGGACSVCPAGTYRSADDTSCQLCPANTFTTGVAVAICMCLPGFSRGGDQAALDCIKAPSSPAPITTAPPEVLGNSITVTWLPALEAGGCGDGVYYDVYLLEGEETEYTRNNEEEIRDTCTSNSSHFCYTITGLRTSTTYSIVVTSASCATNDPTTFTDLRIFQDRFIVYFATTDVNALPAIGPGAAAGIAFIITFLVTALVTGVITAVLTIFLYRRYKDNTNNKDNRGQQRDQQRDRVEFRSPHIGGSVKQHNGSGLHETDSANISVKPSRPPPPYPTATKPSPKPPVPLKPVHTS